ncbi:MAG: ComEC/Rec2 family competence protein [Bacteroidota bacterium]|nr:ComEC/Rec2 family competence protein [Bacteroidota bacterium]
MGGINFFRQAPFVRIVVALAAGITFRLYVEVPSQTVLSIFLITIVTVVSLSGVRKFSANYKYRWFLGVLLSVAVFCMGIYLTGEKYPTSDLKLSPDSSQKFIAIVSYPPEEQAKSVQCFVNIDQIKQGNRLISCGEKLLLHIQKDSAALTLKAGDVLLFRASPALIERTGNPYEFDYRKYLSYQGVRFSAYVAENYWQRIDKEKLSALQLWAFRMRDKLLSTFRRLGITGQELGVASALTIGATTELDNEVKQAYIASGTMHILAVSGMHVALLYWVLNMLLSFLDRNKYTRYLKFFLLLVAVWLYALLTGMGASILRASTMISFLIVGDALNRKSSIFNTLAASAFCLLVWNPFNLVDVGFQLSYLAVISIVIFHPFIYEWFEFDSWFGDQLWSMVAVTLAAQVLTTPISLFYFHQFPNLFLLSNVIMIPLSTVIMYFAMFLISSSGFGWIAGVMGKVFNWLVWLLNKVVFTIEALPYALTKGVYITLADVVLCYLLIIFFTLYLLRKQVRFLNFSLFVMLVLLVSGVVGEYENRNKHEVIVYNENNNSVIQFRNGGESIWLVNSFGDRTRKCLERARDAMGSEFNKVFIMDSVIRQSKGKGLKLQSGLFVRGNFVQFLSKTFVISDGTEFKDTSGCEIKTDLLLMRNASLYKSKKILAHYPASTVVLDASTSKFRVDKISSGLPLNCNIYNVKKSGALIVKL